MRRQQLGQVAEILVGFPFRSSEFSSRGLRLLRGDNIGQGVLRWDGAERWPSPAPYGYHIEEGDVVLAMDRPWISAGLKFAPVRSSDVPSLLVQRVAALRARPGTHQRFLEVVIRDPRFSEYIQAVQTGTAVPHISKDQIAAYPAFIPHLSEQEAIAAVLGALDDKIAGNTALARTARTLAKLGFNAIREDSRAIRSLGALLHLHYGKALPATQRRAGTVSVVGSGGIIGTHDEWLVDGPCVVVGRKGSVGATYWIPGRTYPIDTTYYVEPAPAVPLIFCYFALQSLDLAALNSDSAVPGLNRREALALPVPVPDETELSAASDRALELFRLADQHDTESRTLTELRDTLLPALMSGRLRVKDAERQVEDAV